MDGYAARELVSGLGFIEGPLFLPSGELMFTDIGAGRINIATLDTGQVRYFADTKGSPNGVAVGPDGNYYVCNNGGLTCRRSEQGHLVPIAGTHGDQPIQACIQRVSQHGHVETLYEECEGRPLVAPNDLWSGPIKSLALMSC
ncbi:MAG: SMP-30/gluconolactonase/LRE family protein, partial [Sphingomonadaceae bacterium]